MNLVDLYHLVLTHKWLVVAMAAISWATALLGKDSRFPITIPISDRWKPVLVLALGQVYAVLQAVLGGKPAPEAVLEGVEASFGALGLFAVFVKTLGNGDVPPALKWLAALTKKAAPPAAGLLLLGLCASQEACAALKPLAKPALDMACVLLYAELGDAKVKQACAVAEEDMPKVLDLIAAQRKAGVMRAAMADAGTDAATDAKPDTGTDAGK